MKEPVTLTIKTGELIRADYCSENDTYRGRIEDLSAVSNLVSLGLQSNLLEIYELLGAGKYQNAVKLIAYQDDLTTGVARAKLLQFLSLTLGVSLILNNFDVNRENYRILKPFIDGIMGFEFSDYQIIKLLENSFPGQVFNIVFD